MFNPLDSWGSLFYIQMIDIFEIEKVISNNTNKEYDTICVNIDDFRELKKYVKNGKYKGYYIAGFSIIESGVSILGSNPLYKRSKANGQRTI